MRRLNHPVYRNRLLQLAADGVLVALAFYLAFRLRFLDDPRGLPHRYEVLFAQAVGFVILGKLAIFAAFGLYQKWWRYVSGGDFLMIVRAVAAASAILVVLFTVIQPFEDGLPRSVAVIDFMLTLLLITGARLAVRLIVERPSHGHLVPKHEVLVIGAGSGGQMVVRELHLNPNLGSTAIGFVDDDPRKQGMRMLGLKVLGTTERDRADPRRDRARRSRDRDPLGAGAGARQGRRRRPRARDQGADAADGVRAPARRGPAQPPAPRRPGRGRPRPRPDRRRARPGRRLPARPDRPRHRRRRLDRLRALPPDRPGPAAAPGDARPGRGQPLPDRPRDGRGAPLHQRRVGPRRLQGAAPDAGGDAAVQAERRLPRRRLQARAADGGEPARGGPQQRDRDPDHGRDRRRLRTSSASS